MIHHDVSIVRHYAVIKFPRDSHLLPEELNDNRLKLMQEYKSKYENRYPRQPKAIHRNRKT